MHLKTVLLGACAVALASAQSAVLTFTRVPNPITVGQAAAIIFTTNDTTTPVSIILRKGVSTDLSTIATLTDDAMDGQFIWTPPETVQSGTDYALEITQGDQTNYFGPFTIQGGSASSVPYSSSETSTSGAAATANSSGVIASISAGTGTPIPRNTTMVAPTLQTTRSDLSTITGAATTGASSTRSATSSGAAAALQTGGSLLLLGLGALAIA